MPFLPLRKIDSAGRSAYDRWVGEIDEQISDRSCDRNELCRRILLELYYPHYLNAEPEELPPVTQLALLQLDRAISHSSPSITPTSTRNGMNRSSR
jgi:hypothetical protein